jgi:hypothetical protein
MELNPYRKHGIWIPKWNSTQTSIEGLIYHCLYCEKDPVNSHLSTYMFLSAISDRCPICRNLIDFTDLRELDKLYPGLINP